LDYPGVVSDDAAAKRPFDAVADLFRHDFGAMQQFLDRLKPYFAALDGVSEEKVDEISPYWKNDYFKGDDARVAYAIVRHFKPQRIIEIGSGNSTKFLRKAATDAKTGTRLISIDPSPRAEIDSVCDEVVRKTVVSVSTDFFDQLQPCDVLFIDGSHLVFQGTDGPYLFLRVLPKIRPGVLVHIHDIFLPNDYPPEFKDRWYNEQYLLAAMILGNSDWAVRAPVAYLHEMNLLRDGGVSFWMERTSRRI
jgi:predicted O-methyltransferase YrrM